MSRQISNFIEKKSALIGQRKAADMRDNGPRECSPFVSEQFAFKKTCRHRRALHLDEIAASARALKLWNAQAKR